MSNHGHTFNRREKMPLHTTFQGRRPGIQDPAPNCTAARHQGHQPPWDGTKRHLLPHPREPLPHFHDRNKGKTNHIGEP